MADTSEKIITAPSLGYVPHPGGLGCTLFEKMWENENKLAQVDGISGEEETYKALLKRCIRTAVTMRSKGIVQGDVVTLCSFNNMDVCVSYIATLFLGAIPTALDPALSAHDTTHLLNQVKPKMIFIGAEAADLIGTVAKELPAHIQIINFGSGTKYCPFSDFLKPTQEEDEFRPVGARNLKDTALILFSSGTSGLAKGICLNHYGLLSACHTIGHLLPVQRPMPFASFYWISSVGIMVATVIYGGCRIVVPKFISTEIWKYFDTFKPTMTFLAPSYAITITNLGRPATIKRLALKCIIISGGPISEKYVKAFRDVFPEAAITQAYGQTETSGMVTFFKPNISEELDLLENKPTASGTLVPGYSFKIVDTDTEELLGPRQKGELRVKSDYIMNGYYNLDSSETWDSEGWLKTGDIAYYDEDHCLYIVDRIKELLKYQSFHVPPAALEAILQQHPAVENSVVIGIPHEEDGDHPMALVVLTKDNSNVDPKDIEKFVNERVNEKQRLRAGVKIIDKIPVTPTGKIKRKELKDKVLRGEL